MAQKTQSSISLPQTITMSIIVNTPISSSDLTRHLVFRNFADKEIKLPITLNAVSLNGNELVITDFPNTTHNLQVIGSMNHRSFWDRIYLVNYGRRTEIDIKSITLRVHYVKGASNSILDIPLLNNTRIDQVLGENDEIFLTPFIEASVMKWAGIVSNDHQIAIMAAKDLGKSGTSSEGFDEHGDNPKYRGWLGYECSEFVSWYIHKVYSMMSNYNGFGQDEFKNITFTGQIHEKFKRENKSYYYNVSRKDFYSEANDNLQYIPKAGDILIRRGNNKYEHSMILANWDSLGKIATVIDGPYIITLREVDVQELEERETNQKDYIICSV
jgi:hypothetical protein